MVLSQLFGGFVYLALIDARELRFGRRVLRGTSTREHHVNFPVTCRKNLLNTLLRLDAWILVDKPRQTVFAAPELINVVRSPNRDGGESFYVIDLAIDNEKDIRKHILHHNSCFETIFLVIAFRKRLRAHLVIAMDAQQDRGNVCHKLLRLAIVAMQVEIETCIA